MGPLQWRIQDFPERGAPTPKVGANLFFAENCMKMEEFGSRDAPHGSGNALVPMFWASGDTCPGFQSPSFVRFVAYV